MLEDISGEDLKEQFKSNKNLRMTTMIIGGLAVVVLGYFAYTQFVSKPANEKSKDAYWLGLNYAAADSTDLALDELKATVNKYDGKIGGEVAQFVYASQLMEKGEFQAAIDELEGVKVNDTYVSSMRLGLIGDCYSELENYTSAVEYYTEAAHLEENDVTTPLYLFKAGLCAEEINNSEKAAEYYQEIKDNYAGFASQKQIDKYLGRVGSDRQK